jgi:hypothetical protein
MDANWTESTVPQVTRTVDYGPFEGKFPLAEGKSLTATFPNNKEGQEAVDQAVKQARKAGEAANVTARKKTEIVVQGTGKDKKENIVLTIWTVKRITRPRKVGETAGV